MRGDLSRLLPANQFLRRCLVKQSSVLSSLLVIGLLGWSQGADAQTGTITGRITDANNLQPIASAQVFIPDLNTGVLSQPDGGYRIENVPAGPQVLSVRIIGYREGSRAVTVASGQVAEANFALQQDALALDAIVVTGTPGGTRQRAIGNVVGRVDAAEIAQQAPVANVQDLLAAREPGLSFARTSGNVGTGSPISIRGIKSLGVSNQPLIYVDGIRIDNESEAGPNLRDGRQVNRLNDINPNDIASIEVIKGPAAATLYGTEASGGVIQIITKRGSQGAPVFDLQTTQGGTWLMNAREKVGTAWGTTSTGELVSFNIWDQEKDAGRQFLSTGHLQSYNLSMRGGTDVVRYYVSGEYGDNEGIVDYNWDQRFSTRANVSLVPSSKLIVDVSTGYTDGTTSFMQQRTSWGLWEQAQWATPLGRETRLRGFLRARPESIADVEAMRDYSRFTGSGTITHTPIERLTQRLVVGLDVAHDENSVLFPRHITGSAHDFGGLSLGYIELERPTTRYMTADYAASLRYGIGDRFGFTTSVGAQYYNKLLESVLTEGRVFPAPPIRSLAGAASTASTHQYVENKTLGIYVQQEMAINDRIFLTAAVRGDDNSAFGANYDAAIYPKLSAAWVISEEPFFRMDNIFNSLRLRAAWGQAGAQPDVFAAARLFAPGVGPNSSPSVTPRTIGNPDLGPEVGSEIEVGFDASVLNDRISTQFTYYNQTISDALVTIPVAPTRGFPGTQSVNLGETTNWGIEATANGQVFATDNYAFDLGAAFSYNQNEIVDLGGRPATNNLIEGFPFPAITSRRPVSAELNAEGRAVNVLCDGGTGKSGLELGGAPVPCSEAPRLFIGPIFQPIQTSLDGTLTLFNNLSLFAMVEYRDGGYNTQGDIGCRHTCFQTSLAANLRDDPIFVALADGEVNQSSDLSLYDNGFAKLREVSATYQLPSTLAGRIGASRASVQVAGRNLWTIWQAQNDVFGAPLHDPEARRVGELDDGSLANVPPLASFVATMRVSF